MKMDLSEIIKNGVEQAMRDYELKIGMTVKEAVEKQVPKKPITYNHYRRTELSHQSYPHSISFRNIIQGSQRAEVGRAYYDRGWLQ